jgi:hypothetical protein
MKFTCILHSNRFEIDEYWKGRIAFAVKANDGKPIRAIIETVTPESRQQRKYLHGCILPLLVYLDGQDYRNDEILDYYFQFLKTEFTPELLKINGKIQTFGKSTKGSKALRNFIDRLQDFLHDEYGISYDNKAISTDAYKEWRDTLAMNTNDDWISYCKSMKWLDFKR